MNRRSRERLQSHFVSMYTQEESVNKVVSTEKEATVLDTFELEKAPHLVLPVFLSEKK